MKRPEDAPSLKEIMDKIKPEGWDKLFSPSGNLPCPTVKGAYVHWSKLKHKKPPKGLDHELWWGGIKIARSQLQKQIPLKDTAGNHFSFCMPDIVLEMLHKIDGQAMGRVAISEQVTNSATRNRYIVSSLIEEAIKSSQLEGASTSRKIASNMLRSGRKPKDMHEQMILNNYTAMDFVREIKEEELTPELILNLHRTVTNKTLENSDAAGNLQTSADSRVSVFDDKSGKQLHVPPPADQLESRLEELCNFANQEHTDSKFIHPIIKAIILHFWIGYDHPFEDGNGRLARALFYWSMLKQNYWLFEFISISRNIKKARRKYRYAYLYSETDENDLTYFIIHQLKVIKSSIRDLEEYLNQKVGQIALVEKYLKNSSVFNYRQRALLSHAIRCHDNGYTIKSHQISHNVAYATARADLLDLEAHGLLKKGSGKSKATRFYAADDLEKKMGAFSG